MYSVAQAAKALGITRQRVHQLIASGQLAAERVGHLWILHTLRIEHRKAGRPPLDAKEKTGAQ